MPSTFPVDVGVTGARRHTHDAARDIPHLAVLALTRPDGTIVCNSVGSPAGSCAVPDRAYRRRAVAEGTFVMGTYARGGASNNDSLHFAQPLRDEEGWTVVRARP